MPHRASAAPLLLALLLASCASAEGGSPAPAPGEAPAAARPAPGARKALQAGWMDYRAAKKAGQISSLTLVAASTEAGRLIARGVGRMEGGKVVDDETAALVLQSFEQAGFDRFALQRSPHDPVGQAMQSVWIDRGNGPETLFFTPGARHNPRTEELPDVFDALKKLVFTVHQQSPGSMVVTGEGWSGDEMLNQKVEKPRR